MKRLVEFPLDRGGSVLIKVDELPTGPVIRRIGKDHPALVREAGKTFEIATAAVTPAGPWWSGVIPFFSAFIRGYSRGAAWHRRARALPSPD